MTKLISKLVRAEIALMNPLLRKMNLKAQRKLQDALGDIGAKTMAKDVHFDAEPDLNAQWAHPHFTRSEKAILYLHGGAYTAGSLKYARGFGGVLTEQTGYSTLVLGYRLAPENPWPAALEDALFAYKRMLETYLPQEIAFVGESAGGGLCFCLSLKCRELQLPQPSCIVAISPWVDLSMPGKSRKKDPILHRDTLKDCARMYAGESLKNPLVSPIYGDLAGLPDSLIFAGDREILESDSVRLANHLAKAGCNTELHIVKGMWHAYVLYGIPEARIALSRIKEYLLEKLDHAK